MTTAPATFKRQLARADCADSAAAAAHVVLFPERVFVAGESEPILVPYALDMPADKMRVFMVISAAGGRNFGVAFSLS